MGIRLEVSKVIDAPVERVWSIVSDVDNEPKYWHGTKSINNISREGNRITREATIAFRNSVCKEIVSIEPEGRRVDINILDGPMVGHKVVTLTDLNGKTRVDVLWDIRLKGMLSMFSSMVKGHIEEGTRDALERISREAVGQQP
ncbi:MAG: SRPBCC family protein [Candidatus Nitrosocaldus sp.]|nr:SRPBCC family protein [Candidatus Nitrosocaldus sp.]MDW8276100.1 SRPBCC family protein [Candidatus Nitrosocaldus sp.]